MLMLATVDPPRRRAIRGSTELRCGFPARQGVRWRSVAAPSATAGDDATERDREVGREASAEWRAARDAREAW
jgi:hypothetical protein